MLVLRFIATIRYVKRSRFMQIARAAVALPRKSKAPTHRAIGMSRTQETILLDGVPTRPLQERMITLGNPTMGKVAGSASPPPLAANKLSRSY